MIFSSYRDSLSSLICHRCVTNSLKNYKKNTLSRFLFFPCIWVILIVFCFILFSFCAHHEFRVKPQQPVEEKNSKNVKKYDDEEIHFSIFPGNI